MTRGKKTTQAERAKIVAFCIEHGENYILTAQTYQVSYHQVYNWMKRYKEKGVEGLLYRSKGKQRSSLSETERLRQENEILSSKIRYLERENATLYMIQQVRAGK